MNKDLLNKYFDDQCSEEEMEEVLDWFQTDAGQAFIEKDVGRQNRRFVGNSDICLYPEIETENIFGRIQRLKQSGIRRKWWVNIRVASILLIAAVVASALGWNGVMQQPKKKPKPAFVIYRTAPNQQKVLTLSDGTKIRLNENSSLMVTEKLRQRKKNVQLSGEAYFEVVHNPDRSFIVKAGGATIIDLGTKFNVKTDLSAGNVQVAVIQGKVALKKKGEKHQTSAVLTKNHFGLLRLSDSQITIEKGNVQNYLSWKNSRLIFNGQSLARISRQLERLYDVNITFKSRALKKLNLTADFEKTNVRNVLNIIAHTLEIQFRMHHGRVIWLKQTS